MSSLAMTAGFEERNVFQKDVGGIFEYGEAQMFVEDVELSDIVIG